MLFRLTTFELGLVLFGAVLAATALGAFFGRRARHLSESHGESFGVLQAAMLGVVGLILGFGLSLALSRYEDRRTAIVDESNAIGTTFLRAQTLPEPIRGRTLNLLRTYTERAVALSDYVPGSAGEATVTAEESRLQRQLWALAGDVIDAAPTASAPRLYVETLNEMIDAQSVRVSALNNQVPTAVLLLEIIGAALALGLLAAYLALLGRGVSVVYVASLLVGLLLFVTTDLDRPTRGFIKIPSTVLTNELKSMQLPPAASGPRQTPAGLR